ncbi:MAG TPA: hypothetical protein PKZ32_09850 [Candidatus Melainabacteria bacterium]|nr:hypothetical protein [Candidatus Melainabacteria bacterium]
MHVIIAREIERLRNFACRCEERNDFLTSYWSLKQVLDIADKNALGSETYADILVEIGLVCTTLNKVAESRSHFVNALNVYREIYPEDGFPIRECLRRIELAELAMAGKSSAIENEVDAGIACV